ncbi:MAG: hypothetical protein WHS88_09680 [Anaerohalosphaeraceae bacterium]
MKVPADAKILVLDSINRLSGGPSGLTGIESKETCANIYEAVQILCACPEEKLVLFIASAGELAKESSFFTSFLRRRPHIRCIAVFADNQDCPLSLQQAVWEGLIVPCPPSIPAAEAVRWLLEKHRKPLSNESKRMPTEPDAVRISPEELQALFSPE